MNTNNKIFSCKNYYIYHNTVQQHFCTEIFFPGVPNHDGKIKEIPAGRGIWQAPPAMEIPGGWKNEGF